MSSENINFANALNKTSRDLIISIVKSFYFVDFGIITKVSDDKARVDVKHAGLPSINGNAGSEITSQNIEVMWSSCANIQMKYDLAVGDTVLLLGLRDFIDSISDICQTQSAVKPEINLKYSQECFKAIPFGIQSSPKALITIDATSFKIEADQDLDITVNNNTIKTTVTSLKINDNLEVLL